MIDGIESDPRVAGEVTRYHTWKRLRQQSVGEHSWQIARVLMTVWPDCPRKMLVYCLLHDVGEMAGDIPYPGKLTHPDLKSAMDSLEAEHRGNMTAEWNLPSLPRLTDFERLVFKTCEYLEMWEWGLQEQNLGNKYAGVVSHRMIVRASEMMENLPPAGPSHPDLRPAFKRYVARRVRHERGTADHTREKQRGEGTKEDVRD